MTIFVPLAMLGWIPIGLWLFNRYNGRIAIIAGFLIAWLFLPVYKYSLPGLPDYAKTSALSFVMLTGVILFDRERLQAFKLCIWDVPLLVFCSSGFIASVSNGLGAYDGLSALLGKLTVWFVPYLLGRLYFNSLSSLRELVIGLFIGGLIYVPFCLFEMVMSPRLHRIIYGFHPHDFGQSKRWGGWRPVVFMEHGLMVGMWMVTAMLAGLQLWRVKRFPAWLLRLPVKPGLILIGLLIVTISCKSTGALFLLLGAFVAISVSIKRKRKFPLFLMMLIPAVYILLRTGGIWSGTGMIDLLSEKLHLPEERVGSLSFRFTNEDILMEKAFQRPLFGWAGWKRSFVCNSAGVPISVPDGLWIIVLGQNGWLGLVCWLLLLAIPQYLYLKLFSIDDWRKHVDVVLCLAPVVMIAIFAIDSLLNDMFNPLIMLLAGGITGMYISGEPLVTTKSEIQSEPAYEGPRLL